MKTKTPSSWQMLCLAVAMLFGTHPGALAVVLTNDTHISVSDTHFDGSVIVVSNCTLIVDGPHLFQSLRVMNGGLVTHSPAPTGLFSSFFTVLDETHVLNGTNISALIFSNAVIESVFVTDAAGLFIYEQGLDYALNIVDTSITIVRVEGSLIADGETVLVSYRALDKTVAAAIDLTIAEDLTIEAGGQINVNGLGQTGGPGLGQFVGNTTSGNGAGGGHGGYGGASSSNALGGLVYGSILQPLNQGSQGGRGALNKAGGFGGGAIRLVVGKNVLIQGSVSANGANGLNTRSGGGSGGSIWITAKTITGSGFIAANGGAGEPEHGGGGGGGRIALYFSTNNFEGTLAAQGGNGHVTGGAGTIYTRGPGVSQKNLLVHNGGRKGANTPIEIPEYYNLNIAGGALVTMRHNVFVTDLLIRSNSWIIATNQTFYALGNAVIEQGGGITADKNSSEGSGFGLSATNMIGTGAGHGGQGGSFGGVRGGSIYGSSVQPITTGSAGGPNGFNVSGIGGPGGGAIHFVVHGELKLDGRISADGGNAVRNQGGGGSGGSVRLRAQSLTGSGVISAAGGAGILNGGGGGGGRIAIELGTNQFSGVITAIGGRGGMVGGAGTIFLTTLKLYPAQLIVDNGGQAGGITPVSIPTSLENRFFVDLIMRNGAEAYFIAGNSSVENLFVGSNSWIHATNSFPNLSLIVRSNATIQAGGGINGRFETFFPTTGQGSGGTLNSAFYGFTGGGGGHGGSGSPSLIGALGGVAFGDLLQPTNRGGNGAPLGPTGGTVGRAGGAAIRLQVGSTLLLDGALMVDGHDALSFHGGGGAGGSLWVTAARLAGSGRFSANGGDGLGVGGSGGGGRISLQLGTNLFTGTISARGGSGINNAGAGTIVLQTLGQVIARTIIVDNQGAPAPATPLLTQLSGLTNLTIRNGASVNLGSYSLSANHLFIGSNSWLIVSNPGFSSTSITLSNAIIETGGGIDGNGDGIAFAPGGGNGATRAENPYGTTGGGGGHGGLGGNSVVGAAGGNAFDNIFQPINRGGNGGGIINTSGGPSAGVGGMALRLIVSGSLLLNGEVRVNGGDGGALHSGGGAGGALWMTVGTLTGNGGLTANGGNGNGVGGSGGGGRIAVYYRTNLFIGVMTARGGAAMNPGGAGTIYTSRSLPLSDMQLLVDNGGNTGSRTPLTGLAVGFGYTLNRLIVTGQAHATIGDNLFLDNLLIGSNSWIFVTNNVPRTATVRSNAIVQHGGGFSVTPTITQGSGNGGIVSSQLGFSGGGGGHGGFGAASLGGASGGNAYGFIDTPSTTGSPGGGSTGRGLGGGRLELNVVQTLIMDGTLSADGGAATGQNNGGGSGGSISLSAGIVRGSGLISANGGDGSSAGGGGGGGRIALSYSFTNGFTGVFRAHGGGGGANGGAGTVLVSRRTFDLPVVMGEVTVDNGGRFGTNTPYFMRGTHSLTIKGGAVVHPTNASFLVNHLRITSGGILTSLSSQTNLQINLQDSAHVEYGGAISVAGKGFAKGTGPGAGASIPFSGAEGGGGGYGGMGGDSDSGARGGTNYGSAVQPVHRGSGGGPTVSFDGGGGAEGGGAIRINAINSIIVDGEINADGNPGLSDNSGGGAGGSIWITARRLSGNGFIKADGGHGELFGGGGGGGGRIAIYCPTNVFGGLISVAGGEGANWGQDGSLFFSTNLSVPVLHIEGFVKTTSGLPVSGASLAIGGWAVHTDQNGFYSTEVPLEPFSVHPFASGFDLAPALRHYSYLSESLSNQDYVAMPITPGVSATVEGSALVMKWEAFAGMNFQIFSSSNMVDWMEYGSPFPATTGLMSRTFAMEDLPQMFFQLRLVD
jgi:hypothetical protein